MNTANKQASIQGYPILAKGKPVRSRKSADATDQHGSKLNALLAVREIGKRPMMFIAAAHDKRMPSDIAQRLYEASIGETRDLLIIDGPGSDIHGHAYQTDPKTYISRVAQFLEIALRE